MYEAVSTGYRTRAATTPRDHHPDDDDNDLLNNYLTELFQTNYVQSIASLQVLPLFKLQNSLPHTIYKFVLIPWY